MIILIIILFIIVLLLIGIRISLIYDKKGSELKGCLKILIFKKIKVYSKTFPSEDSEDKEDEEEEEEDEDEKQRDLKKIFNLAKPCFEDLKIFIKSLLSVVKASRLDNHIVFGMDSYADTGKYIGIIWAVFANLNQMHKKLRLSAEPSFAGSVLDAHGVNNLDIYPLKLVVPGIRLLLKKDVRTLIRGVLDER